MFNSHGTTDSPPAQRAISCRAHQGSAPHEFLDPESTFSLSAPEIKCMDNSLNANWWGVVLSLDELNACLRSISHGSHQWTACLEPEPRDEWDTRGQHCVRICYSNTELIDMPNEISYIFPTFVSAIFWRPDVLVCLHPSMAVPVLKGLHFEGSQLRYDLLLDWDKFWPPIRDVLTLATQLALRVESGSNRAGEI